MLALTTDLHPLAARADGVGKRRIEVQRAAHLVEIGDLDLGALAHDATVGLQLAEDELEQRGFARTIRPDQPDLVTTQNGRAEVLHDQLRCGVVVELQRHVAQLANDLATRRPGVHLQPHLAERVATLLALVAQYLQALNARDAARAAGLDALADPHLFLGEQLVCARACQSVGGQLLLLHPLVGAEVAGVTADDPAVEFNDARGHTVEERAVVGDQHHAALESTQQFLEPRDRIQVEVVGGLIEQQHIGHRDQRLRQRNALLHAAGQLPDLTRAIEVQLRQRSLDAQFPVPRIERLDAGLQRIEIDAIGMLLVGLAHRARLGNALADRIKHCVPRIELRLLRHVADAQPLRHLQQAIVEFFEAGDDFQHRRLASAIAADQAEPFTAIERKRRVVEEGHVAESQVGIGE